MCNRYSMLLKKCEHVKTLTVAHWTGLDAVILIRHMKVPCGC